MTDQEMKAEIISPEDIKLLVDKFYEKVNKDELLSPVFNVHANVNWEQHLPKMYKFWGTLLIGTHNYTGNSFNAHASLPINQAHFQRWIHLFNETVDENFNGSIASLAKEKAESIGAIFQYKLGILKA